MKKVMAGLMLAGLASCASEEKVEVVNGEAASSHWYGHVVVLYKGREETGKLREILEGRSAGFEKVGWNDRVSRLLFDPSPQVFDSLVYAGEVTRDVKEGLFALEAAYRVHPEGEERELSLYRFDEGLVQKIVE